MQIYHAVKIVEQKRLLGRFVLLALLAALLPATLTAKTVVFWQPGFPTVASEPVERAALAQALAGMDAQFADLKSLNDPAALVDADLLVLPYGSAVPCAAAKAIEGFLSAGGNLLILGGQPFRVPVNEVEGKFVESAPQDTYSRALEFRHTYEVPVPADARFAWKFGYELPETPHILARRFFAVEGHLNGFGYMVDDTGQQVAAPVIVADHYSGPLKGSRIVALDFDPQPGYWQSRDGVALIRQSALYASQGATYFNIETQYATLRPGEVPSITVHLHSTREMRQGAPTAGEIKLTLSSEKEILDTATLPGPQKRIADLAVPFNKPLPPGFYKVSAVYSEQGRLREFHQNGFWVEETKALASGPVLGVRGDFLTRDGAPYFPVGTNYFTTEEGGWDFSSARNAWVWERDFQEMAEHGVSFVRTGVWMSNAGFVDAATGGVNERFLRNLEAFLRSAQQHGIAVNFTFFAFSPHSGPQGKEDAGTAPPNPYLDPASVQAQQAYIRSVVERFKDAPWLSWDLINEPSFSNPRHIFRGNYPNGDPAEVAAWRIWLQKKYDGKLDLLAEAWRVPAEQLGSFDSVPLPAAEELAPQRYGSLSEIRDVDYNLFAQEAFSGWVRGMVATIRATGSKQLIDVGQDEGGVMDRVLNQFYGADLSFTTNHTYWQDDALLWDSVAAKRPGVPNITGETGYQPVWEPDGAWRYDELTGLGLIERKWALGFAAGSSGALQWDWGRDDDFGMKRSDGSAKLWENQMRALGEFARKAAPAATSLTLPDTAIVLPQSFQMSAGNPFAVEAQQNAIRALYGYARSQAYAVGEYQIELLGQPKLILLPSPYTLSESAWQAILERVKAGAVLLVTGPFAGDPLFRETGRQDAVGLPYRTKALTLRDHLLRFPGGAVRLSFSGNKTTVLSQAVLPNGEEWIEKPLGSGRILFAALPLELNDNLQALGDLYRYALKTAGVRPIYTTALNDPGILICPTRFPHATLYVLTSESDRDEVSFQDARSGMQFTGRLASGEAAILLVGEDGKLLSAYNWSAQ